MVSGGLSGVGGYRHCRIPLDRVPNTNDLSPHHVIGHCHRGRRTHMWPLAAPRSKSRPPQTTMMQNAATAIDGQLDQNFDSDRNSNTLTVPPTPTATAPRSPSSTRNPTPIWRSGTLLSSKLSHDAGAHVERITRGGTIGGQAPMSQGSKVR
jgi:hypothetical protein